MANAYPGIYQGILPQCSYPDAISTGIQFADYHGMRHYFEDRRGTPAAALAADAERRGRGPPLPRQRDRRGRAVLQERDIPQGSCVPPEHVYHPETNPGGVRCGLLDSMINVLGPRPRRAWSPMERAVGRGFAGFPLGSAPPRSGRGWTSPAFRSWLRPG